MNYNIPTDVLHELTSFFRKFDFIDKVEIFGSRARGDHSPKSDIDLCIYSKSMSKETFKLLQLELFELPILYHIDSVHFERSSQTLQKNILAEGISILSQEAN